MPRTRIIGIALAVGSVRCRSGKGERAERPPHGESLHAASSWLILSGVAWRSEVSPMNTRACPWLAVFLLLLVASPALAQDSPGDAMIDKYLARETERLSQRFLDGATTLEEWQKKRPRLRQEYLDMLGLWPLPEKTPLKATVTGTVERGEVIIEKLHYQSRPGLYVTGNLYRPKKSTGK